MILFNNFKAHVAAIRPELDAAIARVLDSGWFILGRELEAFEAELAQHLGVPHAVGVANGTEAIALALMALDVGPGAEVITTNLTAYPTITGIRQAGATPVVVDIDPATGLLDPDQIARHLTPRTRAIVPVHLYGHCVDMDRIMAVAQAGGLKVVEDVAQAIGASWTGRQAGTMGDLGALSFYPTKNLGALGDGGAVVTRDAERAERLRRLRNYGQSRRYYHDEGGLNSRLDELQAAILRVKLRHLDDWTRRRRHLADYYRSRLRLTTIAVRPEGEPVHHLFPVLVDQRDAFMRRLEAHGVQTLIHYPVPVHRQRDFPGQKDEPFPHAERFASRVVSLPLYPELTDAQAEAVVAEANAAV